MEGRKAGDSRGLLGSFRKCDISWEQTVEVMGDLSPRGKILAQIVSKVDGNSDSSS